MKRLVLPKGLTIFSGEKHSGKTEFSLKWANFLAESQNVLYLNWAYYDDRLKEELKSFKGSKQEQLFLDTSYPFFDLNSFVEIYDRIEKENIKVVFFDDIYLNPNNKLSNLYEADETAIVNALLFLARKLDVKVVLTTEVSPFFRFEPQMMDAKLRTFNFPAYLRVKSHQIYFMYRPSLHKTVEEEVSNIDEIEIFSLKNSENKEHIIKYDNRILKIGFTN